MSAVDSVCPPPEELEVKGVAVCPVEGCEREFPSTSHLQMHVARHHEGRKLRGRGGKRLAFYCPVEECERREGGGKRKGSDAQEMAQQVMHHEPSPLLEHQIPAKEVEVNKQLEVVEKLHSVKLV